MSQRLKGSSSPLPAFGFVGLAIFIVGVNACIFDEGTYKKGGRLDTAASVSESSSSSGKTSSSSSGLPLGDDDDTTTITDSGSLVDTQ